MQPLSPLLLSHIRSVAQQLPLSFLTTVAAFVASLPQATSQESVWRPLLQQLPKPSWRQALTNLMTLWYAQSPSLKGESIVAALWTAHYCIERRQEALEVEVVWTGPEVSRIPVRRTEQVLLQLIRSSATSLTLISFAIYQVPTIGEAIIAALRRGVRVRIIAETPEDDRFAPFGVSAGLGSKIAQRAEIYEWPKDKRPTDKTGRYGSLHMKVAIADRHHLFVTSANLTNYALSLNMEMGLLVHSEDIACQISEHLDQLVQQKIISPLEMRGEK